MKLGIIMPFEVDSFQKAKDFDLDFVEFDCNPSDFFGGPMEDLEAKRAAMKQASEETGIEVGAIGRWASHILDSKGEILEDEWCQVKRVIDLGAYLGAKHFLCSVNYVKEISYYQNITVSIAVLRQIVAYAKENGMTTSIVNCMMGDNYIRTPEQWKLVLSEVPGLGIKYDPSHSFVHGGKNGAYIEEGLGWGGHFTYCHVKGVVQGEAFSEVESWRAYELMRSTPSLKGMLMAEREEAHLWYDNPPAGIDVINWRGFFAILYKYGYDGYLAIEPHSSTWQGEKGEKGIRYTIRYIRDLMILD